MLEADAACPKTISQLFGTTARSGPMDQKGVDEAVDGGSMVSEAILSKLIGWIGDRTNYDISRALHHLPTVSFCDPESEISYEGETIIVDPMIGAAYDMEVRHIHLVRPWSPSNTRDLSTLLHELVHDIQYLNRTWSCNGEPEWEAYKLQEAWLEEQGVRSDFNWPQILLLSSCRRDIHP
jgi:hypothetical protein